MSPPDWSAVSLSLQLAGVSTLLLMLISIPLAWWLCRSQSCWRPLCSSLVTLPLVLPPTVLGFYLLMLLAPQSPIGNALEGLGLGRLPFTFGGLVAASVVYSLPFVVQPLQVAFNGIPQRLLDAASSLRAGTIDRFFSIVLPLARPGLWSAAILGFAHTVGEFGVVLMIGGNIPDKTRVVSIALYEHFEAGELPEAHRLAAGLLMFALFTLMLLHVVNRPRLRSDTA